jgi:hypothetical protein
MHIIEELDMRPILCQTNANLIRRTERSHVTHRGYAGNKGIEGLSLDLPALQSNPRVVYCTLTDSHTELSGQTTND